MRKITSLMTLLFIAMVLMPSLSWAKGVKQHELEALESKGTKKIESVKETKKPKAVESAPKKHEPEESKIHIHGLGVGFMF